MATVYQEYGFADLHEIVRDSEKTVMGGAGVLVTAAANAPAFEWTSSGTRQGATIHQESVNLAATPNDPHLTFTSVVGGAVVADQGVAPDGTTSMARMTLDTSTAGHYVSRNNWAVALASDTLCISICVKVSNIPVMWLRMLDWDGLDAYIEARFDFVTGTLIGVSSLGAGSAIAGFMEPMGGGIYRIGVSGIPAVGSSGSVHPRLIAASPSGTALNWTPLGTEWFEYGLLNMTRDRLMTPIILGPDALTVRKADVFKHPLPSNGFSALQGTLYVQARLLAGAPPAANCTLLRIDDGTDDNLFLIHAPAGTLTIEAVVRSGGADVFRQTLGSFLAQSVVTVALGYVADYVSASMNGLPAKTVTSGSMPVGLNRFRIGSSDDDGADSLNGTIYDVITLIERTFAADLPALSSGNYQFT